LADDLLSTVLLSFDGPVLMAPAMNCVMWAKPSVQRNVAQLRADGITLIDPEEGYLSCGMRGPGRMAEPEKIFRAIAEQLERGERREERGEGRAKGV
jgi:phosphopantothenoylcysteine decarboxylase/phosphopantothenate--cysteine ligase